MNRRMHFVVITLALALSAAFARSQPIGSTNTYHIIAKRNAFGLTDRVTTSPPRPAVEPQQDLLLTGVSDVAGKPEAFFVLMEPGKPTSSFMLGKAATNEWLEIKSVNVRDGSVTALLKKPLARLRNVGEEVVLSFESAGLKNRTVALNRGNPHADEMLMH